MCGVRRSSVACDHDVEVLQVVSVVLVGHGSLAQGMLDAAKLILGPQEDVQAFGLSPGEDPAGFADVVRRVRQSVNSGCVLVLADMLGGSPANATATVMGECPNTRAVTGVNLPMLLEVLLSRASCSLDELVEVALRAGREGVQDVHAVLSRFVGEQRDDSAGQA